MEILYQVHQNLYVNLTNRCPCACTFCLRQTRDRIGKSGRLWLEQEPTLQEVKDAFTAWDMTRFNEVVFCGFGEPTMALDRLLPTASFVKETYGMPIRLNTNGLGNLIWKRDITPDFAGRIDTVSISLNTPDKERYHELVRSRFGDVSFDAMIDFARRCTKVVPHVVMTTVATTLTHEEEERCAAICRDIGTVYRIRPWEG